MMILLSETAFTILNWIIVVAFVIINVYITANILKIYSDVLTAPSLKKNKKAKG